MAETEVKQEKTVKRVVGVLSAIYFQQAKDPLTGNDVRRVLTATHGQEVELPESEAKRLDEAGALLPEGSKPEDAQKYHEAKLDAYRAQRGDQEALVRHQERLASQGDIVNVDANVDSSSAGELSNWIEENKPNADDTVALAENDPAKAQKVLEAERTATGGSPRQTVEQRLQKIIDGQ